VWADPRCSTCSICRPRRVTICTATAPDDVRTLRTNRETTPECFHAEVISDHHGTPPTTNHHVTAPGPNSIYEVARVRSQQGQQLPALPGA
jgi:hypothetical protein